VRKRDAEVGKTGASVLVLFLKVLSELCLLDPASFRHLAHVGPLWRKMPRKGPGMVPSSYSLVLNIDVPDKEQWLPNGHGQG